MYPVDGTGIWSVCMAAAGRTSTGAGGSAMTLAQLRESWVRRVARQLAPDGSGDTSLLTLDALASLVWTPAGEIFRRDQASRPLSARWWKTSCWRCYAGSVLPHPPPADRSRAVVMSFSLPRSQRIGGAAPLLPTVLPARPPIPDQQCGHGGQGQPMGPSLPLGISRNSGDRSTSGPGGGTAGHLMSTGHRLLPGGQGGLDWCSPPRPRKTWLEDRPGQTGPLIDPRQGSRRPPAACGRLMAGAHPLRATKFL